MKFIKLGADVSLGISILLFSYVYWFAYRIEKDGVFGMSGDDITNVTVNLFTVAFLISVTSAVLRIIEIRKAELTSKLSKVLLVISLVPSIKILVVFFVYGFN